MKIDNDYLRVLVMLYRPIFFAVGRPLPPCILVSFDRTSQPHHRAEYYPWNRIIVSNQFKRGWKAHRVVPFLVHELCHAAADFHARRRTHHGDEFKEVAKRMGLDPDHIPS